MRSEAVEARERPLAAPSGERATAAARSAAYALFSQLVASPNDAGRAAVALPPLDLDEVISALAAELPYGMDFSGLADAAGRLAPAEEQRLAASYGSLFEVGSDGPPVAIREGLAEACSPRAREEVVRYYSFFGYRLREELQWAPDHLAVELEFLHFLCFAESRAGDRESRLSLGRAQRDFLARHPALWYPEIRHRVRRLAEEPYHRALFDLLGRFLERDLAWLEERFEEEK